MKKIKKKGFISIIAILCVAIIVFLILIVSGIGTRTWVLSYAQKADPPYSIVAHNKDLDVSDGGELFQFSKPIEFICEAKDGKLILTDQTNGKTYEGTYTVNSSEGRFSAFKRDSYTVMIDGLEGTANISSGLNRTLFVSIGGYYLNFEVQ